jgi:hypothetical protein
VSQRTDTLGSLPLTFGHTGSCPWRQSPCQNPVGDVAIDAGETVRALMKSILDPSFRYTASFNTDLRKTFARLRRDQRKDTDRPLHAAEDAPANVSSMIGKSARAR